MKRPERKPNCPGCKEGRKHEYLDDGAIGECKGCRQLMVFKRKKDGLWYPQPHPPKKPRRSGGLPPPRGGGRRMR